MRVLHGSGPCGKHGAFRLRYDTVSCFFIIVHLDELMKSHIFGKQVVKLCYRDVRDVDEHCGAGRRKNSMGSTDREYINTLIQEDW